MGASSLDELFLLLGYQFANPELLEEALSHPSLDHRRPEGRDYQRLEFLGDRVLGLIISHTLYKEDTQADEGTLAVRFNTLVRRETLARVARQAGLGMHIRLGKGEDRQGGRDKPAILADVCEAVIGALYLDGGLSAADSFVLKFWAEFVADCSKTNKDPKTQLQELVQGKNGTTPNYNVISQEGPDHAPVFTVEVQAEGYEPVEGQGGSHQDAEKAAATELLKNMGKTS